MFVSQQVSKSFLDRILLDYRDLSQSLQLNPSEEAVEMRRQISVKIDTILAMKASSGEGVLDSQLQRTLKLELRSAQRTWMRHLVTSARLNRQRRERRSTVDYLTPVAAA